MGTPLPASVPVRLPTPLVWFRVVSFVWTKGTAGAMRPLPVASPSAVCYHVRRGMTEEYPSLRVVFCVSSLRFVLGGVRAPLGAGVESVCPS